MDLANLYKFFTGLHVEVDERTLLSLARDQRFLTVSRNSALGTAKTARYEIAKLIRNKGHQDLNRLGGSYTLNKASDPFSNLEWHYECAILSAKEITRFAAQRKQFGKFFFLGKYEHAKTCLEEIRQDHGDSLYYIEKAILLEQANRGTAAARKITELLAAESRHQGIKVLANVFRLRSEGLLVQWPFERYLESLIKLHTNEFQPLRRDEIIFFSDSDPNSLPATKIALIFQELEKHSTIDRYLGTLKCTRLILHSIPASTLRTEIVDVLAAAAEHIVDDHLYCLLSKTTKSHLGSGFVKISTHTEEEVQSLEGGYLSGNFEKAVDASLAAILRDPTNAYFYEILIKSLLHSETSIAQLDGQLGGTARRIATLLHGLYSEKGATSILTAEIDALAVSLGDNHVSHFLRGVAQTYRGFGLANTYLSYGRLNHRTHSAPVIIEAEETEDDQIEFSKPSSSSAINLSTNFSKSIRSHRQDLLNSIGINLHPAIYAIGSAKIQYDLNDWPKVIEHTSILASLWTGSKKDLRWVRQLAVFRLESFLHMQKWEDAANLFSDCFLELSNFCYVSNLSKISALMEASGENYNFELEILAIKSHLATDYHTRSLILGHFIRQSALSEESPSELLENKGWYDRKLAKRVFIGYYPKDALKYLRIERQPGETSIDAAHSEYIRMCVGFLEFVTSDSDEIYYALISSFAKQRERSLLLAVEEAKLVSNLEEIRSESCIIIESILEEDKPASDQENNTYVNSPILRCFDLLKNEFLYNDRLGLRNTLGTRIRHGFFYNTFFDTIEESGLASQYSDPDSDAWEPPDLEKHGIVINNSATRSDLYSILRTLTADLISTIEEFRDNEISLKRHDRLSSSSDAADGRKSYFDFEGVEEIAKASLHDVNPEAESVFNWSLDILRARLEYCLSQIREDICGNFRNNLVAIVENFKSKCSLIALSALSEGQILSRAQTLQDNLSSLCPHVSNWFKIAKSSGITGATIEDVINTVAKSAHARRDLPPLIEINATTSGNWKQIEAWFNVLYLLFSNARAASRASGMNDAIKLYAHRGSECEALVGCENRMPTEAAAIEAKSIIEKHLLSIEADRMGEIGGTGLMRASYILQDLPGITRPLSVTSSKEWISIQFGIEIHEVEEVADESFNS